MGLGRTVANAWNGRTKITNHKLEFSDALTQIEDAGKGRLADGVDLTIHAFTRYDTPVFRTKAQGPVLPTEASAAIATVFREREGVRRTTRHQEYSGNNDRKHYFDFGYAPTTLAEEGALTKALLSNATVSYIVLK